MIPRFLSHYISRHISHFSKLLPFVSHIFCHQKTAAKHAEIWGGDLDSSLQKLLTESMEELERQMASKEAETGLDGGEDGGDGSSGICHHLNT